MKRIIALVLALAMVATLLTGCGKNRELFDVKMTDYVTLGDYKNISIDRTSKDYKDYYDYAFENAVYSANAYAQQTTGAVKDGDVVNIDYSGKKDGVAFDGGTASNQFLTIGSGQFIEGFESGLIGKEIGSTVDLNLTFPETYGVADLAGKAVVFTVKINYVQILPTIDDELAVKMGFATSDELLAEIDKRAIENCIYNACISNSKVNKYPDSDKKIYDARYQENISQLSTQASSYGYDLDTYLYYMGYGSTANFQTAFYQQMEATMIFYAILDAEALKFTDADIDETVTSLSNASYSVAQVRSDYQAWELEALTVQNMVIKHIREKIATVK